MAEIRSTNLAADIKGKLRRVAQKNLRSEAAEISQSAIGVLAVGNDASVSNSVSLATVAGHDALLEATAGSIAVVGHDLKITNGGSGIMLVAGDADVEGGFIGVLAAGKANLTSGTRILMTLPLALAFGAAVGATLAVIQLVLRGFWHRR